MNILDQLTTLRSSTQGSIVVALSDLSSGVVLCSSAVVKQPQERLDALAKTAARLFKNSELAQSELAPAKAQEIIAMNSENVQIFIRSAQEMTEVMCCVCSLETDVADFLTRSRAVLCEISVAT